MTSGKAVGGWCQIRVDGELRKVLIHSGVLSDKMLTPGKAWVPRWVRDAIKIFKNNEGFAGLSLADFLNQMRPEAQE